MGHTMAENDDDDGDDDNSICIWIVLIRFCLSAVEAPRLSARCDSPGPHCNPVFPHGMKLFLSDLNRINRRMLWVFSMRKWAIKITAAYNQIQQLWRIFFIWFVAIYHEWNISQQLSLGGFVSANIFFLLIILPVDVDNTEFVYTENSRLFRTLKFVSSVRRKVYSSIVHWREWQSFISF